MRIELVPGLDNVIRFPVERRIPVILDLLYEIAPDVREVLNVAAAFGLEAPDPDLRRQADRATAETILDQVPREPAASAGRCWTTCARPWSPRRWRPAAPRTMPGWPPTRRNSACWRRRRH